MDLAAEQHGECTQVDDDTADQVRDLSGVILGGKEGAAHRDMGNEDAIEVFGRNGENGAIVIKLIDSFKGFSLEGAKIDELIIQKVEHYAEQAKIREQERLKAEEEAKRLASEKAEKDALKQAEKEALLAERLAQEELDRL